MALKRSRVDILGVGVDDFSEEKAVLRMVKLGMDRKNFHYVVTVNAEFVMLARRDPKFARILANADFALADGAGVVLAKLILGGKIHQRVTGVDLVQKLCRAVKDYSITVGFLGGFGDVANVCAKRQKLLHPRLKVAYAGADFATIGCEMKLKPAKVAKMRADILFVAYGMGRQEFWIEKNKKLLNVGVAIGVGGAFDFIAGVKKRAPEFLRKAGMEWFFRLLMEPSRIKRMSVLPIFMTLVLANFAKNLFKKF